MRGIALSLDIASHLQKASQRSTVSTGLTLSKSAGKDGKLVFPAHGMKATPKVRPTLASLRAHKSSGARRANYCFCRPSVA